MALPDGTLPFSGGAMMGGDGSPVSRDDIFKLRMTRGGFTTEAYDPLQSPDTEVDINETELFSITRPGIYAEIVQSLASGRIPTITAGTDGRVRRYYYTASDAQAGTMAFTNGHDGLVEILTLHSDGTYEIAYVGGVPPSILVAQSDTMEGDDDTESQDFTFSQIEKVGDDIYIDDNNEIRLKKGIYHVSLVITFNVNSTEESRPWIEEVTFNYPLGYSGTLLDRSIRWPHGGSSNISVDFDYVVNADDTKLEMWLNSLGDEAYAKMKPISIHKIAEVE